MRFPSRVLAVLTATSAVTVHAAAQGTPAAAQPPAPMTFFITSAGKGDGATLTEAGMAVHGVGYTPNTHDILTGSDSFGRLSPGTADVTCSNWTSNGATGSAMVGHSDRTGGGNSSWNSAHPSRGCGQSNLVATGGAGLFFCFAAN